MKLYVVTQGEYSDYHIEKIFLDKDKAENYAKYHRAEVEEWETDDEDYEIIKNGYYYISLDYKFFQDARFKWFYKLTNYQVKQTYNKESNGTTKIDQYYKEKYFFVSRYVKDDTTQEEAIEKVVKIAQDILTFVLDQLNQGASWEDIKKIYEEKQL